MGVVKSGANEALLLTLYLWSLNLSWNIETCIDLKQWYYLVYLQYIRHDKNLVHCTKESQKYCITSCCFYGRKIVVNC